MIECGDKIDNLSVHQQMNKENVGYTQTYAHNGRVLSHKREWNFAISSNMFGHGCHYAK